LNQILDLNTAYNWQRGLAYLTWVCNKQLCWPNNNLELWWG